VQETLEGPLTCEECKKILETFQNDKAPGEDAFTIEFFTYFYLKLLGNDLTAQESDLIWKEDGSLLDLSNWRPIHSLMLILK